MSQKERDWLHWLKGVQEGEMTRRQAAEWMEVSERWVRELVRRYERMGDGVVVHGLRGRASNRRIEEAKREAAVKLLRQRDWHDFGPTFASEQLAKRGIAVSKETVRQWMMAAGLWESERSSGEVAQGPWGGPLTAAGILANSGLRARHRRRGGASFVSGAVQAVFSAASEAAGGRRSERSAGGGRPNSRETSDMPRPL